MRKKLLPGLAFVALGAAALWLSASPLSAADDTSETHLHIHVTNDLGKPVGNAEVIVRFLQDRIIKKKKVNWELRTTQEGTVSTPGIPQGKIMIQVYASNYQTFGQVFDVNEPDKNVEIKLLPPQAQYSSDPAHPDTK